MTSFWARFAHAVAIAGQIAAANQFLIPPRAIPWVQVGLAFGQGIIGAAQHKSNPDGSPAEIPYKPVQ